MTIKDAIENLRYLISEDCTDTQHDYIEEIQMAITALERQEQYEKEGVWIQQFDGLHCSKCGYKPQTTMLPVYCPNCYTKMCR